LNEVYKFFSQEQSITTIMSNLAQLESSYRPTVPDGFKATWNGFLGKTSSLPEDMHSILANSMDLDATRTLDLDFDLRMKAIFHSVPAVPIGILFDIPPEYLETVCAIPADQDALRLPRFPGERGKIYASTRMHAQLQVTPHGLRLEGSSQRKAGYKFPRIVGPTLPETTYSWQWMLLTREDSYAEILCQLFVTPTVVALLESNIDRLCFMYEAASRFKHHQH
jgi:hypothetical protein